MASFHRGVDGTSLQGKEHLQPMYQSFPTNRVPMKQIWKFKLFGVLYENVVHFPNMTHLYIIGKNIIEIIDWNAVLQ